MSAPTCWTATAGTRGDPLEDTAVPVCGAWMLCWVARGSGESPAAPWPAGTAGLFTVGSRCQAALVQPCKAWRKGTGLGRMHAREVADAGRLPLRYHPLFCPTGAVLHGLQHSAVWSVGERVRWVPLPGPCTRTPFHTRTGLPTELPTPWLPVLWPNVPVGPRWPRPAPPCKTCTVSTPGVPIPLLRTLTP